ncbi:hypothetical protein [Granulicella arctica]|uniref:hypothetical protein n=1 Tax=Granulicella arctica TaxID=940613 RepID=UPI0021E01D9D|nr:hypothetical protein [Granulicella arctica]
MRYSSLEHRHPVAPPIGFSSTPVRRTTPWNDVCDEIIVPVASLLAVFLVCAAVIAFS